ncbi:MAG: NTP transferase domain-containing protein [Actinomycetota bacterium]|nr:NTP transferase domain-containing protein [Actinomycetota bacterium]
MRVALLAAGRGVRMGGTQPKTLIPLGGREPMLFHILSGLKLAGVDDVLVVTGFKPDAIQGYIASHFADLDVTYVFNARFASWGNFHSVRVALDQSPASDVLVVNSDVIVHPEVYGRVVETSGDLVLAVQKRRVLDPEDMRVRLEGDRVLGIGKDLKRGFSHGEYAGVSLLRPPAARAYGDIANALEWSAETDLYYEDVYARILPTVETRAARVGEHEYAEVDTPDDVAAAVAVVDRHPDAWATAAPA